MWDIAKRGFITSYVGHTNWVRCVRFINDGSVIVSCADDKTIKMWDKRTGHCIHTYTAIKGNSMNYAYPIFNVCYTLSIVVVVV